VPITEPIAIAASSTHTDDGKPFGQSNNDDFDISDGKRTEFSCDWHQTT
jgi:hypothetical protein